MPTLYLPSELSRSKGTAHGCGYWCTLGTREDGSCTPDTPRTRTEDNSSFRRDRKRRILLGASCHGWGGTASAKLRCRVTLTAGPCGKRAPSSSDAQQLRRERRDLLFTITVQRGGGLRTRGINSFYRHGPFRPCENITRRIPDLNTSSHGTGCARFLYREAREAFAPRQGQIPQRQRGKLAPT